jgi:hypothetical protein
MKDLGSNSQWAMLPAFEQQESDGNKPAENNYIKPSLIRIS